MLKSGKETRFEAFYKISFDAWLQNGKKYSAQQAIQYLEKDMGNQVVQHILRFLKIAKIVKWL